uniref:Uncharacterized protein n=1 Tax=Cucumis sativus TaxID=3659 RepID=A0A0A0KYD2_CUCSA
MSTAACLPSSSKPRPVVTAVPTSENSSNVLSTLSSKIKDVGRAFVSVWNPFKHEPTVNYAFLALISGFIRRGLIEQTDLYRIANQIQVSEGRMGTKYVHKSAKYKTSVKDPGTPGVLEMTECKFVFRPSDPTSASKLDVEFRFIKGHKNTKEGSNKPPWLNLTKDQGGSYIFEFKNFSDLHVCRELVGSALAKLGEAAQAPSERPVAAFPHEQLSKLEMELRMRCLQEDSELQKLHKQFVIGGVLTESEFWAARKKLLEQDNSKKSKQLIGFKSSMVLDTKPMSDGRTNKVTFNLTPEIKYQA